MEMYLSFLIFTHCTSKHEESQRNAGFYSRHNNCGKIIFTRREVHNGKCRLVFLRAEISLWIYNERPFVKDHLAALLCREQNRQFRCDSSNLDVK